MTAVAAPLPRVWSAEGRIVRRLMLRLSLMLATAVYTLLMVWVWRAKLAPAYEYMGAADLHPPVWSIAVAVAIAIAPSLFLPLAIDRPSAVVQCFFYFLAYVPFSFVPLFVLAMPPVRPLSFSGFLLVSFALLHLFCRLPRVRIRSPRINTWPLILAATALSYIYVAYVFGLHLGFLKFEDVYTVRLAFREASLRAGRWPSYFIFWISNVFNPLFIIEGLITRRVWLVFMGVLGQFVIYSMTGFKTVFFSWLILAGVYLIIRSERIRGGLRLAWAAVAAGGVCALFEWTRSYLLFRFLATGMLTGWYFEFFSTHPKAQLGDGILSFLHRYPYDVAVPYLIGTTYLHNTDANANVNVFADAFANFGYPGVIVWTVAWGLVLWLYDCIAQTHDRRLSLMLLVIPSLELSNVGLQTTLMTQGLALAMLVLWALPRRRVPFRPGTLKQVSTGSL